MFPSLGLGVFATKNDAPQKGSLFLAWGDWATGRFIRALDHFGFSAGTGPCHVLPEPSGATAVHRHRAGSG